MSQSRYGVLQYSSRTALKQARPYCVYEYTPYSLSKYNHVMCWLLYLWKNAGMLNSGMVLGALA